MKKKTKAIIAAGVVGIGAYLIWKNKMAPNPTIVTSDTSNGIQQITVDTLTSGLPTITAVAGLRGY